MRVGRCLWVAVALAALCVGCDDQDGVRHLDAWVDTPIADADVDATPVDAANVTVAASASTGGTVTVTVVTDGTCSGTSCTLATGASTVTFTPTASTGYRFDTWTGSSCTGYTASGDAITFTNPIVDHACTASFVATVDVVAVAGAGGSIVATSVTGGVCTGTACTLDAGASTVTFTPTAAANHAFSGWSGCTGYTQSGDSITFTNPTSAKACTASFGATVAISATAGTGGTVAASSVTGGGCSGTSCTLDSGASTVTFTPTPNANYRFNSWSGCTGYTQSGNAITFTNPTTPQSCTASFVATVSVSATAGTGGSVAAGTPTGGTCVGTTCALDSGASSVTFTPTANANYRFGGWTGCTGYTQSGNAITFTNPTAAKACTANFVATVIVSASAGTGGTVAASTPTGGTCAGTTCTLDSGASSVTFTPTANANFRFGGWSGASCTGYTTAGDSITFTNPATAKACTASFVATVNVSASAGTGGTVAAGAPAGGTCTGTNCTLDSGASSVTFTASPIANYRFGSWSGATCTGGTPSGSAITFTNPTSAKACIANFVATVAVSASAGTGGTVAAGTPTGGTCSGTNCTLDSGASSVTFTAQAGTNYRFSSWSGSTCTGGTPSGTAITFTNPTSAKACTANFVATVSVSAAAGTGGSVAASGLTGATCSGTSCTLDNGASTVTFTPSATSGYRFNGWSGTTCTGYSQSGNAITFTNPTTAKACTASFVATVVVAGAAGTGGSVSVFSYSGGSCAGTTCTLDSGASSVTFQATPSANYRFSSWSGCSLSTSSQVTITNPTISTTCTANFVATVVIDAVPAPAFGGSVAVTSLSNGTCSGTSCTMDSGSGSVQFTPTPASNFRFAGWSGGTCFGYFSGAGNSIIFSGATASHSCVAEFVATVTVEAAPTPTGSGSVTVDNLSGGTCVGSSCVLDSGSSSVTFWPEPAPGYRFVKWTGASCSGYIPGQDNEIIFIDPTSSHGCRANFEQAVTVQVSSIIGNGSVVVTTMTNATCTNLTCLVSTGAGTVTFTPVPGGPNSPFQKWLGNSCNGTVANDGSMTFTNPTSDHDCQAYFSP